MLADDGNGDHTAGRQRAMMATFAALFAALLATAIWALVSYLNRTRPGQARASPEDLLAECHARGEITTTEYQERLATLRK